MRRWIKRVAETLRLHPIHKRGDVRCLREFWRCKHTHVHTYSHTVTHCGTHTHTHTHIYIYIYTQLVSTLPQGSRTGAVGVRSRLGCYPLQPRRLPLRSPKVWPITFAFPLRQATHGAQVIGQTRLSTIALTSLQPRCRSEEWYRLHSLQKAHAEDVVLLHVHDDAPAEEEQVAEKLASHCKCSQSAITASSHHVASQCLPRCLQDS
jgi:hypothetical protein